MVSIHKKRMKWYNAQVKKESKIIKRETGTGIILRDNKVFLKELWIEAEQKFPDKR